MYRLIKKYPGSPEIGTLIDFKNRTGSYIDFLETPGCDDCWEEVIPTKASKNEDVTKIKTPPPENVETRIKKIIDKAHNINKNHLNKPNLVTKDQIDALTKKREEAKQKVTTFGKAIEALQSICSHQWRETGRYSHYSVEKCYICGKEKIG